MAVPWFLFLWLNCPRLQEEEQVRKQGEEATQLMGKKMEDIRKKPKAYKRGGKGKESGDK